MLNPYIVRKCYVWYTVNDIDINKLEFIGGIKIDLAFIISLFIGVFLSYFILYFHEFGHAIFAITFRK